LITYIFTNLIIMTTTNGTYKICPDHGFSISMNCEGPSCSSLIQYNNLNCINSGSESFECTNGVTCSGAALFTSDFEITQDNATVLQTQNVQINGTNFVVQQGGMGNATVLNGTSDVTSSMSATPSATSTGTSPSADYSQVPNETMASYLTSSVPHTPPTKTAATSASQGSTTTTSSSAPKSGATYSQSSYFGSLLLIMLALSIFVAPNVALDVATIGEDIHSIFEVLYNGAEAFGLSQENLAGPFDGLATAACETLVGSGVGIAINIGEAFAECEEAMASSEITAIGAALKLGLTSYTGIAGTLLEGLGAAEEGVAIAAEPEAIPAVLIANSALCAYLVTVQLQGGINNAAKNLCEAVESAASVIAAGTPTAGQTPTISTSTTSTSTSITITSSSTTSFEPSVPTSGPGLPIPDVSNDPCASCELSVYFLGVQGLAADCNVAVPVGQGYDLAVLLCDSTYNGKYAAFCQYLCANQCVSYNIQDWINNAGSQWQPDATLALCAQDCPGFKGDGRCQSGDYCPCAQGANTCKPSNC
jgi:hypothetical protein